MYYRALGAVSKRVSQKAQLISIVQIYHICPFLYQNKTKIYSRDHLDTLSVGVYSLVFLTQDPEITYVQLK